MTKLYRVNSLATNLHGYKDVNISWVVDKRSHRLFGAGGSLNVPYQDVITDYDEASADKSYAEHAIEELFTEDEAKQLVNWLRVHRNDETASIEQHELPIENNIMPFGAIPCGGGTDFLLTGEADDYDLSFKVSGYYDLRGCKFGGSNDVAQP